MFFLQFSFCPLAFDLWLLLSGHFSLHWIWESEVVEINIRHFKAIYAVFCLIHITNGGSNLTFFSQSWSPPQEVIYLKHPNPSPVQQNTTKITHPSHLWILKNVFFFKSIFGVQLWFLASSELRQWYVCFATLAFDKWHPFWTRHRSVVAAMTTADMGNSFCFWASMTCWMLRSGQGRPLIRMSNIIYNYIYLFTYYLYIYVCIYIYIWYVYVFVVYIDIDMHICMYVIYK